MGCVKMGQRATRNGDRSLRVTANRRGASGAMANGGRVSSADNGGRRNQTSDVINLVIGMGLRENVLEIEGMSERAECPRWRRAWDTGV